MLSQQDMEDLRLKIIENICTNDKVFFKSQQIDDPDFTADEKKKIVLDLFNKKDSIFLSRFGNHIDCEYLKYFEQKNYTGDEEYIVQQHLARLKRWHKNRSVEIRNRRYAAMQKMITDGTYFSESEMMNRQPLLYDQLVGQYLSEADKRIRDDRDTSTLVNVLLNGMDDEEYSEKLASEMKGQDENSSSSSEASYPVERVLWGGFADEVQSTSRPREKCITSSEKDLLRQEFVGIMYSNFLEGSDKDFDYTTVDDNADYDNDTIRSHDEEEKYFDADDDTSETENIQDDTQMLSEDELDVYMEHLNQHPSIEKQL